MEKKIWFNSKTRYAELSNMHECALPIKIGEHHYVFRNLEAAYQCLKQPSLSPAIIEPWTRMNGFEAKQAGKRVQLRNDWNDVKLGIMRKLVSAKFSHPRMALALLATEQATLVHYTPWNDHFWGVNDAGAGHNWLGAILMEQRAALWLEVGL